MKCSRLSLSSGREEGDSPSKVKSVEVVVNGKGSSKSVKGIMANKKLEVLEEVDGTNNNEKDTLTDGLSSTLTVFENNMLREMILRKVMILPSGKLSKKDVGSLRIVQKSWLVAVSDIFRKRQEPLHELTLGKTNFELLAEFVQAVSGETALERSIPNFSLKLEPDFFGGENHRHLLNCLVECGSGLVSFDLAFPINNCMILLLPTFELPALQRLTIQFSNQMMLIAPGAVLNRGGGDASRVWSNHHYMIYPIQAILNAGSNLKELNVKHATHGPHPSTIPIGFDYLSLPKTITKLFLDCPLRNSDLTLLVKNDLSNLVQLRLYGGVQYDRDTFYIVLNKIRTHLRILNLRGARLFGPNGYVTRIRFPVMESLENLTISSPYWELDEGDGQWVKQLPVLKELRLLQQTVPMVYKWANTNALSSSLKLLFVFLIENNNNNNNNNNNQGVVTNPYYVAGNPIPLTLEIIQGIQLTMPFVTCLGITVCGEQQSCALKYLFMEMKSLQKLAISVKGSPMTVSPFYWDSLLTGVPLDMAAALRKFPDYWTNVELKDNFPSIRNLTELKSLALLENCYTSDPVNNVVPDLEQHSLISDVVFQFGFLKMPTLQHLLLTGRFKVEPVMCTRWKNEKKIPIRTLRRQTS